MYQVFLGKLPLPIAPGKIETSISNKNETVELIDGGDINILKSQGLTEISFEFMVPSQNYPFMTMAGSLLGGVTGMFGKTIGGAAFGAVSTEILNQLEKLKVDKKPFQFIVVKMGDGISSMLGAASSYLINNNIGRLSPSFVNMKVSLEDYTIIEDAENGMDVIVSVKLKQYRDYSTKVLNDDGTATKTRA